MKELSTICRRAKRIDTKRCVALGQAGHGGTQQPDASNGCMTVPSPGGGSREKMMKTKTLLEVAEWLQGKADEMDAEAGDRIARLTDYKRFDQQARLIEKQSLKRQAPLRQAADTLLRLAEALAIEKYNREWENAK